MKKLQNVIVNIENISFSYGDRNIFQDFSFKIPKGISLGILGGNGAGKTTLIKLIAGIEKAKCGKIHIFDNQNLSEVQAKIGYMPQQNALYNDLSVFDNLDFFASMYGIRDKKTKLDNIDSTLQTVDLWDRKNDPVSILSGGMQRRVSLACVLVHNPDFILLDEPTVGLDPDIRVSFWQYFKKLTNEGKTLFITSHTMDDAMHCDRLIFIKNGRIIAEDTPENLILSTDKPNSTLEDAFIYFNSKGYINDSK